MAYKPDYENGIMRVQYQRRVGKIGIDSKAGWVATVDSTDGYVFVHRFEYEQGKAYPDNSSVEIWMNGLGEFVAWGKINKCEADPNKNPYNFESEVISPYARLEPGQKYTFHYEFYSAKIPTGLGIVDCSNSGVICEAPVVLRRASKIQITGKFGVFYEGNLSVIAVDEHGNNIKELASGIRVSPVTDFDLNLNLPDPGKLNEAKAIVISLYDQNKKLIGVLARAKIPPQS
jgi:hypothetical protein